jgi:hypothetical protein
MKSQARKKAQGGSGSKDLTGAKKRAGARSVKKAASAISAKRVSEKRAMEKRAMAKFSGEPIVISRHYLSPSGKREIPVAKIMRLVAAVKVAGAGKYGLKL